MNPVEGLRRFATAPTHLRPPSLARLKPLKRAEAFRAVIQIGCFVLLLVTHDAIPPSMESVLWVHPRRVAPVAPARAQCEQRNFTFCLYASGVPYADKIALCRRNNRRRYNLHCARFHCSRSSTTDGLHQNSGPVVTAAA
jgi:hypothetical protein